NEGILPEEKPSAALGPQGGPEAQTVRREDKVDRAGCLFPRRPMGTRYRVYRDKGPALDWQSRPVQGGQRSSRVDFGNRGGAGRIHLRRKTGLRVGGGKHPLFLGRFFREESQGEPTGPGPAESKKFLCGKGCPCRVARRQIRPDRHGREYE